MAFATTTTTHSFFLQRKEKPTFITTTTTTSAPCFNLITPSFKQFILKAAASSSGAEFSDQLFGAMPMSKKRRIAGVDQDELLEPEVLADPDSCFCEFEGLKIHYKECDAESEGSGSLVMPNTGAVKVEYPMILLHGFGASVFSWNRVIKPLSHLTCSKVIAFDRPAFGLTSRVDWSKRQASIACGDTQPPNPYSIAFSALATLYFIDTVKADKAILVAHSAGATVAVEAYFKAPERVAALILVAPAVVAPPFKQKVIKEKKFGGDTEPQRDTSNSNVHETLMIRFCNILSRLYRFVAQAISQLVKQAVGTLNSLYTKALTAFLRSAIAVMLIRIIIDKFGVFAVRSAWYDSKKLTDHDLDGYTKPLRAKSWDKALLEFTAAILADYVSESKPAAMGKRLDEISCPVLIVTGDNDRLVPSWNANRLSKAIPGSCFEVIKNCGHMPHEEKVDEFLSVVANFLHHAFGGSRDPPLEAATRVSFQYAVNQFHL